MRHFETVKFPITSSPRARPSNWASAELYRYKIVAVSLHKTHICVVKSLVKIAAVSWHSLRRFIKPAPDRGIAHAKCVGVGEGVCCVPAVQGWAGSGTGLLRSVMSHCAHCCEKHPLIGQRQWW